MTEQLRAFYKNKKIFLTGHTGFKGCWLKLWLERLGAQVTGYALPPEPGRASLHALTGGGENKDSIYGDVADYAKLKAALEASGADIVFHLAAQALVRRSYGDPVETYRTNVMGSVHMLEAVRTASRKVKAVINVTSDKCYRNDGGGALFDEDDPLGGHDPYSSSKAAAELVTDAYRRSFFSGIHIPLASARAGNVIGGGDFAADRLIPDLIEALLQKAPAIIRNPDAVRPWQHVLDALHGYVMLAAKLHENGNAYARSYNFGPGEESVTVRELADRLIAALGRGEYRIDPARANLHEAPVLRLDAARARKELGWRPVFDAERAVGYTAEWYKTFMAGNADIRDYTLSQIDQYMRML